MPGMGALMKSRIALFSLLPSSILQPGRTESGYQALTGFELVCRADAAVGDSESVGW